MSHANKRKHWFQTRLTRDRRLASDVAGPVRASSARFVNVAGSAVQIAFPPALSADSD